MAKQKGHFEKNWGWYAAGLAASIALDVYNGTNADTLTPDDIFNGFDGEKDLWFIDMFTKDDAQSTTDSTTTEQTTSKSGRSYEGFEYSAAENAHIKYEDVDGDGDLDKIMIKEPEHKNGNPTLEVHLRGPDPTQEGLEGYVKDASIELDKNVTKVYFGDHNEDGKLDLFTYNSEEGKTNVRMYNGAIQGYMPPEEYSRI